MMDYAKQSDAELLQKTRAGDRAAEEALAERYSQLVSVCARPFFLVGGDKKDLIQEGMFGLVSAVREFDPSLGVPFRSFAEQCVRRRLLSAIRSATRQKHLPLNESISFEQLSEDPSANASAVPELFTRDPEDLVLARESKEELYSVFSQSLSKLEISVLEQYLEGRSYREIAKRLGLSEKSVDNAVQRIRRKLARNPIFGDISKS